MIFDQNSTPYSVLDLGFDKTLTRILLGQQGTIDVPPELINVFTQGTSPKNVIAGELITSLEQQTGVVFSGKTAFDNTQAGFRLGIENDLAKFYIGNTTDYINWDGTDLTIVGGVSIDSIDIGGSDATSFHVDVNGNMWLGAATLAAAPFSATNAGVVVSTSITATGTINATGGYIGSTTALVFEAQGINTGTTGYIRGGQTAYDTGTGYFLGYSSGQYRFSIGVGGGTTNNLTWDGTNLTVNGYVVQHQGSFGGNGADGALSVSSGTTTIDLGSANFVVKNYTSISVTGTGKIAFSNPHANGTVVILKSQGTVVLTSSTVPLIELTGIGAAAGSNGTSILDASNHYGANGGTGGGTQGAGGAILDAASRNFYTRSALAVSRRAMFLACGSGGGNGGSGGGGTRGTGGGGAGSHANAGAAGGDVSSAGATAGGAAAGGGGAGGGPAGTNAHAAGGGGAGGMVAILYNSLTAASGTIDNAGGTGGQGSSTDGGSAGAGGRGGGAMLIESAGALNFTGTIYARGAVGVAGGNADGSAGGAGGASDGGIVTQNVVFG